MSGSINKVILIGNLGADPDIRHLQSGRPVCNLRIATSERWRDKATGEQRERTEWHRVVIFNEGLCRVAERFLHKGSKVYLEGQLQTRRWQDQASGQERFSTEVVLQGFNSSLVMLDGRSPGGGGGGGGGGAPRQSSQYEGGGGRPASGQQGGGQASAPDDAGGDIDDEIPF